MEGYRNHPDDQLSSLKIKPGHLWWTLHTFGHAQYAFRSLASIAYGADGDGRITSIQVGGDDPKQALLTK